MPGDKEQQDRYIAGFVAVTPAMWRFQELIKKLRLEKNFANNVMRLYCALAAIKESTLLGEGSADESDRFWMAYILYVVKKLDKEDLTLSSVLLEINLSVVEFFREMPQFLEKCTPTLKSMYGDDFLDNLQWKEDQVSFVHLMVLLNHYKNLYAEYFCSGGKDEITAEKKFGWLLFLTVRTHILGRFPDLVTCTHALLCVMSVMVVNMPASLRCFSLEDPKLFQTRGANGINFLASLSKAWEACEANLLPILKKLQDTIPMIFPTVSVRTDYGSLKNLEGFNPAGLVYFDGFLEPDAMPKNLEILEKRCAFEEGTIDAPLPTSSDISKMTPTTPVSTTMTTVKWLRKVIAPLPAEPSSDLLDYFKSCDRDITEEVKSRVTTLLEAIFPVYTQGSWKTTLYSHGSVEWTEQRRSEAAKLYYRVLAALCRAEFLRLQSKNLTSVLTSEKFHRCMLACSSELVLAAHKTIILSFPAVLGPTGITAFDLLKVIEPFVRHEPTLPRELKRHLNFIEERILEGMAWQKGSSMYNSLIVAKPKFEEDIRDLGLLAEQVRTLEPLIPSYTQKGKDVPVECATPTEFMHETVMNVFFQKVLKLAASRIKSLAERLPQPGPAVEEIFQVFEFVMNRTPLCFNRHIDQIILCSTYGVCKVSALPVSFKDIIFHYRRQQIRPDIYKNVYLRDRNGRSESGDIIKFYNRVFISEVKPFLIGVQPSVSVGASQADTASADTGTENRTETENRAPSSPPRHTVLPAIPDMSPRKVSTNHNVFVSPLRNKVENIMSPHSKSLYACVGESTRAYQSPSKDLNVINLRLNGRRLEFQEPSFVPDSFVDRALANNNADAAPNPVNGQTGPTGPRLDDRTGPVSNDNRNQPSMPPPKRPRLE